jgi:hypothetical protein
MDPRITVSLNRLKLYLERVERDIGNGDRYRAMANVSELAEVARRLWDNLAKKEPLNPHSWRGVETQF